MVLGALYKERIRQERDREWREWLRRKAEAERDGEPFDEPNSGRNSRKNRAAASRSGDARYIPNLNLHLNDYHSAVSRPGGQPNMPGQIAQVIGTVVDVEFPADQLPQPV